jgi:hypothetical protein
MKNNLLLLFLVLFSYNFYGQQQIITICSEKNGCEFAKVNLTKAQIDDILQKPNFMVMEKEEVILNIIDCESIIEKNTTPQQLHQKYNGKGSCNEIKNFDLRKFMSEKNCCRSPINPNAGEGANTKIGLNGNFTFTSKFTFSVQSSEGNFTSYFYLNLKNGYSLMDNSAMKKLANQEFDGEINQIMTPSSDFYQFMKSPEGSYSMKLGAKNKNTLITTQKSSTDFFKNFHKTGIKKMIYGSVQSEEYNGIDADGTEMSVWLSCSKGISVDKKITYAVTGFFGLGYVVSPTGETFLVNAIEGNGMKITLNTIEIQNKSFSGASYKPMGEMMGTAISQNQAEINKSASQENQYGEAMMQEMLQSANQFGQTSDIQDLPSIELANSTSFNSNYYDYIILGLQQAIEDRQQEIINLDKNTSNYKKRKAELICLKNCAEQEKTRFETLKQQHLAILNQYKEDEEEKNEKINELIQTQGAPKACDCD